MMCSKADTNDKHVSDAISVRQFLHSWDQEALQISNIKGNKEASSIAAQMGISSELADELSTVCGTDTLRCGDEPSDNNKLLKMKGIPNDLDLTCVKYQEREIERRKQVDYKLHVLMKMKYRANEELRRPDVPQMPESDVDRVPQPNVVLSVHVHRPRRLATHLPKGETFLVLGTQCLTDLRDCITCMKDDAIAGDFSDWPNCPNESLCPAKKIYKSGMFFIENTFYNDMREAENLEYSESVIKWAQENKHEGLTDCRDARMEDTTFLDLDLQLGVPYLYQHQGSCEHIVVFTDLRIFHCDDIQDIKLYPYVISETKSRRTICRACLMESAKWLVYDSQLTPESPCFMCHSCFTLLHYDIHGQKICDFKAYKYRQKVISQL